MKVPTHAEAFQALLMLAAEDGRGNALFGNSLEHAMEEVPPFLVGEAFPNVYLEHPLAGDPLLDITVLYASMEAGMRIASPAAGDHGALLDWYASIDRRDNSVSLGFEIDTSAVPLPQSAIHFQPRTHRELVRPFCELIGEPDRAELYLTLANRMPKEWPLSFFGMFRGRARSPLRVCGYLSENEIAACANDPSRLASVFDTVGFLAYDDAMLRQISDLLAAAPSSVDFQFDMYSNGRIGDTFAIDVDFGIKRPGVVLASFEEGTGAHVMRHLESWGVADNRWRQAVRTAFARAIHVKSEDADTQRFALVLMPQWAKVRWTERELQPAKLYHLAYAGPL